MSVRVNPADRKVLLVAGTVALALVAVAAVFSSSGNVDAVPTTYSSGSGGARAAYLLLRALGYTTERWERPVRDLPPGAETTLILAEPEEGPTKEDQAAVARFLEGGGRVVATGASGASFLAQDPVQVDSLAGMTWTRLESRSPSAITRAAPSITMAPAAFWKTDTFAVPLYGDTSSTRRTASGEGRVRVVKYDVGRGDIIWWASATPLTNAGIAEPGNLEFFLACLGGTTRRILWEESLHGHSAGSASRGPTDGSVIAIGLQLAMAAAAVLLTYSRRSGPIVQPPVDSRLSPLEFVRTLGSLYARAGAASVAVDVAYQRFRFQVTKRLGVRSDVSVEALQQAVRDRWQTDDADVGAVLIECDSARRNSALTPERALALTAALSDLSTKLDLVRLTAREHV